MRFALRLPAAVLPQWFSLSSAAALAAIAVLGTPVRAASITERPTFHVLAPPSQGAPGRGPLTFTPFEVAPLDNTGFNDLTVGPDGNMWITAQDNPGTVVRLTPKGAYKRFTYSVGSQGSRSLSITPGPDGALWFVDYNADLVGKVTTKGIVTTYHLPTSQGSCGNSDAAQPQGITAGPDGAMWFTVSEGDSGSLGCPPGQNAEIGRITTTGQMTFFAMPEIGGRINSITPIRITAGPDGLLWFTTINQDPYGANLGVGSITTSGAISVSAGFPGTSGTNGAEYLTFGSNNELYVSDMIDDSIIRVSGYTPVATYPVSSDVYGPYGITSGPDGKLWFTMWGKSGYGALGEMTLGGTFTLYQIPPSFQNGCCGTLAFRGKHDLWFTYGAGGTADVVEATNIR